MIFFKIQATVKYSLKYSISLWTKIGRHVWNFLEADETIPGLAVLQLEEKQALILFHTGNNQLLGLYAKRNRAGGSLFNWLLTAGA